MGTTEKQSLINSITLQFAEDYNLNLKDVKAKLSDILSHYHVTMCEEIPINASSNQILMAKFTEGKKAAGMSDKTINQYKIAVQLLEKFSKKQLFDIEANDINLFLQEYGKTVSTVTLRAKYQLLSSVFNYLHLHQLIPYNPILYINPPKATVVYKQPMTDVDLEKIKNACEKLPEKESVRNTAILYTFLATGCRVSELANIRIKDCDFDNKLIKVMGKGRKERPIVLNDKTIYRIKLYLGMRQNKTPDDPLFAHIRGKEKGISKDGIEKILKKLCSLSCIDGITCHSFRRYYATELRKRNVSVQMIANSLGHANLNQINRYSLYSSVEMLDSVRNAL